MQNAVGKRFAASRRSNATGAPERSNSSKAGEAAGEGAAGLADGRGAEVPRLGEVVIVGPLEQVARRDR
jgi:hypothetical protein